MYVNESVLNTTIDRQYGSCVINILDNLDRTIDKVTVYFKRICLQIVCIFLLSVHCLIDLNLTELQDSEVITFVDLNLNNSSSHTAR